jgi:hypothetical protein
MSTVKELAKGLPKEVSEKPKSIYDSQPLFVISRHASDSETRQEMLERIASLHCPRCQGDLVRKEDGLLHCVCGTFIEERLEAMAALQKKGGENY